MADSQLDVLITGEDELSPALAKLESQVIRVVGAVSAALAGLKVAAFPIISAADFESELVQVQKTTNFTSQEIDALGEKLLNLSKQVNVSALDLAKIAAAAGQHGLGKEGVEGVAQFTDSVARMASVLNLTAEEASQKIIQVINVFKTPIGDLEKAVSAFNQVANNSTAQGAALLDVVRRIGDAAGALNLQQSIALGAAGLDLGVSPEVVGSAISTMFAKMRSKAEDFGRLMNMSATQWIDLLQKDGVAGFKLYLEKLRTLDEQSQSLAITKLTGGGRQGALLQKFVQDSTNSILDKEIRNSSQGFEQGTSALREQLTVINSLKAQAEILKNNIFAIAEQSGKTVTGALTTDIAQLSAALQTPEIQRFANAIVSTFGDIIQKIVDVTKFVASLNINWENFLEVAKVFISLKLASVFVDLGQRLPGIGVAMKLISNAGADAAVSKKQLANATTEAAVAERAAQGGWATKLANLSAGGRALTDYIAKIAAYRAAVQAQQAAETELAEAKGKALAAEAIQGVTQDRTKTATQASSALANDIVNQRAALQSAQQQADAQRAAQQEAVNARLEASEREHEARMAEIHAEGFAQFTAANEQAAASIEAADERIVALQGTMEGKLAAAQETNSANRLAIENNFQAQMAAVSGRGKTARLAELQAEMDAALAAEDKRYSRSTTSTRTYYQNQIELAQNARTQIVAQQEAMVADAVTTTENLIRNEETFYSRSINGLRQYGEQRLAEVVSEGQREVEAQQTALAKMQANLANASNARQHQAIAANNANANAAATAAGVEAATQKVTAAEKAMTAAKTAALNFGTALTVLGTVLGTVARIATGAFFWVTILFSIADATGLLDKFGISMVKITDFFGLTSKAARDQAAAEDDLNKKYIERNQLLQDTIDKTAKYKDASGNFNKGDVQADLSKISLGEGDAKKQGLDAFLQKTESAIAEVDQLGLKGEKSIDTALAARQKQLDDYNKQIADLQNKIANPNFVTVEGVIAGTEDTKQYAAQLVQVQQKAANAEEQIRNYKTELSGLSDVTKTANSNLTLLGSEGFAKLFTNESAKLFQDQVVAIGTAEDKVKELTDAYKKAAQEAVTVLNDPNASQQKKDEAKAAVDAALLAVQQQNILVQTLRNTLVQTINVMSSMPGVPDNVKKSFQDLLVLAQLTGSQISTISTGLKFTQSQGIALTGALAGSLSDKPATSGTGTFNPKDQADKIAKAKLQLERANAESRINLAKEISKELLDADKYQYDQGLLALKTYFEEKQRIELENTQFDIQQKQLELKAAQGEIANAKDEAEKIRGEADVAKIQGQINVLTQRGKGIEQANRILYDEAKRNFDDMIRSESAAALSNLIGDANGNEFQVFLDDNLARARVKIQRLETEIAAGRADLTPILDAVKLQAQVQSVVQAMAPMKASIDTINGAFAALQNRLELVAQAGLATQAEVDKVMKDATGQQINALNVQIGKMQELLTNIPPGSLAYQRLALDIENAKNETIRLANETDKFAIKVNQEVAGGFKDALAGFLDGSISSLDGALKKFTDSLKKTLANAFAEDFTQSIVKNLGIGGSGGIGGLLSKGRDFVFGGSNKGLDAAAQTIPKALAGKPDGSASNPLWVNIVNGIFGAAGAANAPGDLFGSLGLKSISNKIDDSLGGLAGLFGPDSAGGVGNAAAEAAKAAGVGDNTFGFQMPKEMGGIFDGFTKKLGDLFGGLGERFSSLFQSFGNLFSGGGGGDGFFGGLLGLFGLHHTGGIVGEASAFRLASPAIFRNAQRFHSGGLPGLGANEVAAILQKGEEVLTQDDPRNTLNGGRAYTGIGGGPIALQIHPDAIHMTLSDWLEGELSRINANR